MSAKITNIRQLQSMGVFADRNAKTPSLGLRKYNLIYGFNGSGKSTLSRMFASLEVGGAHPNLPAGGSFEFALDDGTMYAAPGKLSGIERRVVVFNADFIEANLQWAQGKANPVFYIGVEQAEAAARLDKLDAQLPQLRERVLAAERAQGQAEKTLSNFKRDRAKIAAKSLHRGNRKYEAPQILEDYEAWKSDTIAPLDETALGAHEETLRATEALPGLTPLDFDVKVLSTAYSYIRDICGQTLSDVTLDEVQRFPDLLVWLQQGHAFHETHALDSCLFCGGVLKADRMAALKEALDDKIDQFIDRLNKTGLRLSAMIETLEFLKNRIGLPTAFDTEVRAAAADNRTATLTAINNAILMLRPLGALLDAKITKPATPVDASHLPSDAEVLAAEAQLGDAQAAFNALVERHNTIVSDFIPHRQKAESAMRRHHIADCRVELGSLIATNDQAIQSLKDARSAAADADDEAAKLRQQIRSHGAAADAINQLIRSYLGHQELAIRAIDEGYQLLRHGKVIKGSPSEGEKTAIALCYFLSTLEADGRKLKDLVVIVDDPVSSLDTKALNYACALLRSRLEDAAQIIVLTHNQQCLNEFRKAWKTKARPTDGRDPTATLVYIDVTLPEGSDKRISKLKEMPALLREYDSEYHFLFSHVLKFQSAGAEHSEHGYMMSNVLRRVLDIFLAFKCPGGSGLPGKIDELCKHYEELDRARLAALERLSQVESHSDNLDDLISFSSMTLEETKAATAALLDMMEKVDPRHLAALRRICRI